jgi:hypothetical protein
MPDPEPLPPADDGNFLTRQAGPLPVWGWVAVGVVGYLGYRWYTTGSFFGSSSSTTPTVGGTDTQGSSNVPGASPMTFGGSICRMESTPDNKRKVKVCGQGHWYKLNGVWVWVQGPLRALKGQSGGATNGGGGNHPGDIPKGINDPSTFHGKTSGGHSGKLPVVGGQFKR